MVDIKCSLSPIIELWRDEKGALAGSTFWLECELMSVLNVAYNTYLEHLPSNKVEVCVDSHLFPPARNNQSHWLE